METLIAQSDIIIVGRQYGAVDVILSVICLIIAVVMLVVVFDLVRNGPPANRSYGDTYNNITLSDSRLSNLDRELADAIKELGTTNRVKALPEPKKREGYTVSSGKTPAIVAKPSKKITSKPNEPVRRLGSGSTRKRLA